MKFQTVSKDIVKNDFFIVCIYMLRYILWFIAIVCLLELILGLYRNYRRASTFRQAKQHAAAVNKPLLVIGGPKKGFMNSIYPVYGCGDVCIDLHGCECKHSLKGDVLEVLLRMSNNRYVIFESCVLEVLDKKKQDLVLKEIERVSGGDSFFVRIAPTIYTGWIKNLPLIEHGL